jgi:Uri superfamily endonuclease
VYRFAKISTGAYFYTGSEVEVQTILNNYPDFRYEGPALERDTSGAGQEVFRFANIANGGYFYTGSAIEKD